MKHIVFGLLAAAISSPAAAAGGESGPIPFHPSLYFCMAVSALAVIVFTSLKVENIAKKAGVFVAVGGFTYTFLHFTGGAEGVLHHVYHVDYPQFIMIPALTVLIASMNLLQLKVDKDFKPGWFMWISVPLIGNFATTWALVPIAVSLFPVLQKRHPKTYWTKMILMFIFGANILALGTVLADPPQAYWAVQLANAGTPMDFFYTGSQFWLFMLITWLVYGVILKYVGVEFGDLNLGAILPRFASYKKVALALGLCGCLAYALLRLQGYEIFLFLAFVFVFMFIFAMFQGKDVRHDTVHWSVETFTIFIAFFAVVSYMHVLLGNVNISDEQMVFGVMGLTWMADNAAAFAAGYPQFDGNTSKMLWYNLFPSVTQGSMSPLGNGPQIVAFLVILTAKGHIKAGKVFKEWMTVCWIFAPYLFFWTASAIVVLQFTGEISLLMQLLIGFLAAGICFAIMEVGAHAKIVRFKEEKDRDAIAYT